MDRVEGFAHGHAVHSRQASLDGAHRRRRAVCNRLGKGARLLHDFAGLDDGVDEAQARGLRHAGGQHLGGDVDRYLARQALQAAGVGGHADMRFGQRKGGALDGYNEVAGKCELGPPADGEPLRAAMTGLSRSHISLNPAPPGP